MLDSEKAGKAGETVSTAVSVVPADAPAEYQPAKGAIGKKASSLREAAAMERLERIVKGPMTRRAVRTVNDLMGKTFASNIRHAAARTALELSGRLGKRGEGDLSKQLHEMTYDQLAAIVQRSTDVIEGRIATAKPVNEPDRVASTPQGGEEGEPGERLSP